MSILAAGLAAAGTVYDQTNLVSNIPGLAAVTDPNLKNPWGISFTAASPFWIADNGTGLSTLYTGAGIPNSLVVTIPGSPSGTPTGTVANGPTGFNLTPNSNPARFIFASEDGSISAW